MGVLRNLLYFNPVKSITIHKKYYTIYQGYSEHEKFFLQLFSKYSFPYNVQWYIRVLITVMQSKILQSIKCIII